MEVEVEGVVVAVGAVVLDGWVGGAKEREGVDGGAVVGAGRGIIGVAVEDAGVALGKTEKPDAAAVLGVEVVTSVLAAESCPKENEGADLASAVTGFPSTGEGEAGVKVIAGTDRVCARDSEVIAPVGCSLLFKASPFFCSCILALILAIASASRSCFSHFENPRKPDRVGLSVTPTR